MPVTRSAAQKIGARLLPVVAPKLAERAPGLSSSFVRQALARALNGVGPLPPAAAAADKQLAEQRGDVEKAIHEVIENHVRFAGAQGFVTNLGGLVAAPVSVPANIAGVTLLQCRLVAGIAHLRGYDLADPQVRNAILVAVLGEDTIKKLVRKRELPAPPMAIATAPAHDPALDAKVSSLVAADVLGRISGKRAAALVGKKVPVLGGFVGLGADAYSTWKIGRYADREFLPRTRR